MAEQLTFSLTTSKGATLYTKNTFCDKDIAIIPKLQEIEVTPKKQEQEKTVQQGYAGIRKVKVLPIPEQYVIPEGHLNIVDNGTFTVADKAVVTVLVNGGEYTPTSLIVNQNRITVDYAKVSQETEILTIGE